MLPELGIQKTTRRPGLCEKVRPFEAIVSIVDASLHCESKGTEISYHPHFGRVLPNGNLQTKTAEVAADGERLDGIVEVGPGHPNYGEWLQAIMNKERHFADRKREQMAARERRRFAAEQKREENSPPSGES